VKKFLSIFVMTVLSLSLVSVSSLLAEEYEGTLEVIMATETVGEKTCQPLYFVNTGNGKKIRFSLPAHAPPNLSPRQKIKISGQWEDEISGKKKFNCRKITAVAKSAAKKPPASTLTDNLSGYLPEQNKVLGERKILVVCVTDQEHSTESWGKEKIEDKISSNKHSLDAYWKACSIDKNGEPQVWLTGDVFNDGNWKMMEKNWSDYGYGSVENELDWANEFTEDMVDLLDPEVDFTKYDGLVVFRAGKDWRYDWSTVGKNQTYTDDGVVEISLSFLNENDIDINNDYAAHESGHGLFSLEHAQSQSIISGEILGYGDWWENRGKQYALLDGLHKWILGWLDISQIKILTSSSETAWIDQRELASSGIKLLVIPLSFDEYGIPTLIYLEYHRGLGEFDSQLSFLNLNTDAFVDPNNIVLIRKYENITTSPYGDSVVYMNSEDDCLDLETQFCDSEYENIEHYGVCVKVKQKTGEGETSQAEVEVSLTNYSAPTPTPTPTPEEMTLFVSVNGVDAITNDNIVVGRGDRVTITVRAEVPYFEGIMEDLQADKITCQIKNSRGKVKLSEEQENTYEGSFSYKIKKKAPLGWYPFQVNVFKKGHKDASFQAKFKVQ